MTNTTTAAATSTDVVATAHRQPATPPTAPVITRPDKPPSVVPAMYSPPMPATRPAGARATRWAIASAGSAPSANPATARSTRRTSKEGANGSAAPATAALPAADRRPVRGRDRHVRRALRRAGGAPGARRRMEPVRIRHVPGGVGGHRRARRVGAALGRGGRPDRPRGRDAGVGGRRRGGRRGASVGAVLRGPPRAAGGGRVGAWRTARAGDRPPGGAGAGRAGGRRPRHQ